MIWYIDDLSIAEKDLLQTPFPFAEDFESGLGNWLISGEDWDTTSVTSESPTHSVTDSPEGNYPPYSAAMITLAHPIDLSMSVAPVLEFWHKYDIVGTGDYAYVYVSMDGGFTWEWLEAYQGYPSTFEAERIDVSNYASPSFLVRFLMGSDGNAAVGDGWHVDDVAIRDLWASGLLDDDVRRPIPTEYFLSLPSKNPMDQSTRIEYGLPRSSRVTIEVYSITGRRVETLVDQEQLSGYHQVIWSAHNLCAGLYFYRLEAEGFMKTRKVLVVR
jgi:hypothetical protein